MSSMDEAEDALVAEYRELRLAVANQVEGVARLTDLVQGVSATLHQVRAEVASSEAAGGKQAMGEILANQTIVMTAAERLETQVVESLRVFGRQLGVMALAVNELKDDANAANTRAETQAKAAAERAETLASTTAHYVQSVAFTAHQRKGLLALAAVCGLAAILASGFAGWFLRGWADPPPSGALAAYLDAGNRAEWLLCKGAGEPFKTQYAGRACTLKIWIDKPVP